MDDTKKTLLSIDIDTAALVQNAKTAKDAIKDLTDQLTALKTAGQDTGPAFTTLSTQLKTATTDYTNTTKALTEYTAALTKKTTAETADAKATPEKPAANVPDAAGVAKTGTPATGSATTTKEASKVASATDKDLAKRLASFQTYYKKIADLQKNGADSSRTFLTQELQLLDSKDKAYEDSANTFANIVSTNNEYGKAAVLAKKVFGAAEIAINTEQQLSSIYLGTQIAVTQDMEAGPILGPVLAAVDIAGGVIKAAAAIASGAQQVSKLNSITVPNTTTPPVTKKARGGIFQSDGNGAYVTGSGTGTSDSINAMLSNGESVINARSTKMFGPILSAINQAGGGVSFHQATGHGYAQGGLFNGSNTLNDGSTDLANTRAMNDMVKTIAASMPRQVLVVEDVQAGLQNKVMLQNMSNF